MTNGMLVKKKRDKEVIKIYFKCGRNSWNTSGTICLNCGYYKAIDIFSSRIVNNESYNEKVR